MSRRPQDDGRQEPQFGYQYHRQEPHFDAPRPPAKSLAPRTRRERSLIPPFLVGAVLIVFAGFLWMSYVKGPRPASGELPIITADMTPVKVKPDKPGGADIPFQDTTVYDDLNQGRQKHKPTEVEHLLQAPEQPLPLPAAPPVPVQAAPVTEEATTGDDKSVDQPLLPAAPLSDKTAQSKKQEDDTTALVAGSGDKLPSPSPPPTVGKPAIPLKPPKPITAATGQGMIQLGSFHDETAANTEWQRLKSRYGDSLAALSPSVQRVDLGDKGTWYRLKAGPVTPDQAAGACAPLKAANAPCVLSAH